MTITSKGILIIIVLLIGGRNFVKGQIQISKGYSASGLKARILIGLLVLGPICSIVLADTAYEDTGSLICTSIFWSTLVFGFLFADQRKERNHELMQMFPRLILFAVICFLMFFLRDYIFT